MKFRELVSRSFQLNLTINEVIDLWRIVSEAERNGNKTATKFVNELYTFAEDSNYYIEKYKVELR